MDEAQAKLLDSFNETAVEYDNTQTILSLFKAQVAKTPDALALVYADKRFTYREVDVISDRILSGELKGGDRIPSVREYGADIGVNPNTMMRSYEKLTADGIIYNKRGIGYFVADDARETVLATQRKDFIEKEVPAIKQRMQLLGLDSSIFNE